MTHDTVRATIADGATSPDVAAHLAQCESCRSFAAAHAHVVALAPTLTHQPTDGLADRILGRLELEIPESTGGSTPVVVPFRRRPWDGALRRVTAVAAAFMLVAAAVSVALRTEEQDPRSIVLASAERTAAEGSAEVQIDAEAEVVVDVPAADPGTHPAEPDFTGVPAEMQAQIHANWEATMLEFERQLAQFQADVDAALREYDRLLAEWERQLEDAFGQFDDMFGGHSSEGRGQPTFQPHPDAPPPPGAPVAPAEPSLSPPPPPPTAVSARLDVSARGAIAFGDGLRLTGTATPAGQVELADGAAFGLHVEGDTAAYLAPDGAWTQLPGAAGPLGGVMLDPGAVSRVLAAAGDDVVLAGRTEVDGTAVGQYRFTVAGDVLADAQPHAARWNVEAWIDDEGRTRRLTVASEAATDGSGTVWRTRVDLRLSAFGRQSSDEPPPAPTGRMELPARSSLLIYPFGANVEAAFDGSTGVGR